MGKKNILKNILLIGLIFSIWQILSFAQDKNIHILNRETSVFDNKNCIKNKSCTLKKVNYLIENYKIQMAKDDFNYGTRLYVSYETDSVENLEDYVFVQFIKGCMFYSRIDNGKVVETLDVSKPFLGGYLPFKFENWVIDSSDSDPAYNTISGFNRHAGLRWNNTSGYFIDNANEIYYKDQKPPTPVLYTTDRLGSAFYTGNRAKNISLVLRMCVYKTKDVPINVDLNNTDFAEPIHCYEWSSSQIFNHETQGFEHPYEISSVCK